MVNSELIPCVLTPWKVNGKGKWELQPVIFVVNCPPFTGSHPNDYIVELERLHDDPSIERLSYWTLIGEFRDALESYWDVGD